MPEYLSPGVYVEEKRSGQAPIASVSTTIAGFIGQVDQADAMMPLRPDKPDENFVLTAVNDPQLITSWGQFKEKFGDFPKQNRELAHAVYGFFLNGGSRSWVMRVADVKDAKQVEDALLKFEAIDEITMVLAPGTQDIGVQNAVINHCVNMKDRFAILDGQRKPAKLDLDNIKGGLGTSDYAAIYFPWIKVRHPFNKGEDEGIPPSGHIAGLYARTDVDRGVHKAPANEIIRGALGVEWQLSKADQMGLNPKGVNVIRKFNGDIKVWGARTLGGDDNTEFKYINVRRLFLMLRESIDEGTQWVVFEPNDKHLWDKIRQNITAFLTNVWRNGALFGETPEEAFYVKCDAELNPKEVRDLGQVITEIGVAPVTPAEFVIFRIQQK